MKIQALLIMTLDGIKWSASCSSHYTQREITPGVHQTRPWEARSWSGLGGVKKYPCLCRRLMPGLPLRSAGSQSLYFHYPLGSRPMSVYSGWLYTLRVMVVTVTKPLCPHNLPHKLTRRNSALTRALHTRARASQLWTRKDVNGPETA